MFTQDFLKNARRSAENAVADMADKDLRVAAFSVILERLLSEGGDGAAGGTSRQGLRQRKPATVPPAGKHGPQPAITLPARILSLREDGFFASQRPLVQVREELRKHGWHYPVTTLSGAMQKLVGDKELRREQLATEKGKRVWMYSNR